jgi:hypothetical protein
MYAATVWVADNYHAILDHTTLFLGITFSGDPETETFSREPSRVFRTPMQTALILLSMRYS